MPSIFLMNEVTVLTEDTFEPFLQQAFVVVDFWAPWCGPCRALLPVLDKIAQEYGICIGKVSVEDETMQRWVEAYKVRSIPTLLFFRSGKLMETHVGLIQERDLLNKIHFYRGKSDV